MANGRPTGDESGRPSTRRAGRSTNQEGLAALGREMRSGSEPESVANESGLRSLAHASTPTEAAKRTLRRSGAPKWSRSKKTVVALLSVVVLLVAVVGGGYAYLWYRFDQIDKIHVRGRGRDERRSLHHVGHRLGHHASASPSSAAQAFGSASRSPANAATWCSCGG